MQSESPISIQCCDTHLVSLHTSNIGNDGLHGRVAVSCAKEDVKQAQLGLFLKLALRPFAETDYEVSQ